MLKNKAQSLSEYSICLVVILVALITINVYVKRGLQGRYHDLTDYPTKKVGERISESQVLGPAYVMPKQYEPDYINSATTVNASQRMAIETIKDNANIITSISRKLFPTTTTVDSVSTQ